MKIVRFAFRSCHDGLLRRFQRPPIVRTLSTNATSGIFFVPFICIWILLAVWDQALVVKCVYIKERFCGVFHDGLSCSNLGHGFGFVFSKFFFWVQLFKLNFFDFRASVFKQVVVLGINKLTHLSQLTILSVGYLVASLGVIRSLMSFLKSLIDLGRLTTGRVLEWVKEVIPRFWMA